MRNILLFISALVMFSSCNDKTYKYWDISEFEITENALKNGEKIKILYASQGPDINEDKEYYYHYVIVSKKTGDTVNVLSTKNITLNKLTENKNRIRFVSLSGESMNFLRQLNEKHLKDEQLKKSLENNNQIKSNINLNIEKVARDPEFDNPAIIGYLGVKERGKDKWEVL